MFAALPFELLADAVLILHFFVVLFVVGGLLFVLAGNIQSWQWVNNLWFRVAHIGAIGIVILESWLGIICPLTTVESWLRLQAVTRPYKKGFIEHWVQGILFYDAPTWAFTTIYTLFGLLIAAAWWYFPPRLNKR